jgi:site-specific recombinase XerD
MRYYGKQPALYRPKTCKTYCFRMPGVIDPGRRQVNTWQADRKEAERARREIIDQEFCRRDGHVYEEAYLDKAMESYFTFKKGLLAPASLKRYRLVTQEFMLYTVRQLSHMPRLNEIKRELIVKYRASLIDRGQMPKTCNEKRNVLTNFFIYCMHNNWIKANPVHNIPKIPDTDRHFIPLTREEIKKILKYLKNEKNSYRRNKCYYEVMAVIYYAGLRISEVTHLLKSDIDFNSYTIHVRSKEIDGTQYKTKTKRNWCAPINKELESILKNWIRRTQDNESVLLFPNTRNKPLKRDHIADQMRRVMHKIGFPAEKIRKPLHGGRHAFISHAIESGVPESVVQSAVGHKSNVMTKHYTHLAPDYIKTQFDKLSYGQTGRKKVK